MEFIINVSILLVFIFVGFLSGRYQEKKHLKELEIKEKQFSQMAVSDLKTVPANWNVEKAFLVTGSVVIATDYFKIFISSLQNLFGGEIKEFQTLIERGRREAIVRMLAEARSQSANAVWNVRIETMTMRGKNNQPGGVELVAYGTALKVVQ